MRKVLIYFILAIFIVSPIYSQVNPSDVELSCGLDLDSEEVDVDLQYNGDSSGSIEVISEADYATTSGATAQLSSEDSEESLNTLLPTPEPIQEGESDYNVFSWIEGDKSGTRTYCGTYDIDTMEEEDRENTSGIEYCNVVGEVNITGERSKPDVEAELRAFTNGGSLGWKEEEVEKEIGSDGVLREELGRFECEEGSSLDRYGVTATYTSDGYVWEASKPFPKDDEENVVSFDFNTSLHPYTGREINEGGSGGQDDEADNRCTYDLFGRVEGLETPLSESEKGAIQIGNDETVEIASNAEFGESFATQCIGSTKEVKYVKGGEVLGETEANFPNQDNEIENVVIETGDTVNPDDETEINDASINYEAEGLEVSLSTDAEAAGGLDSVEWDVDGDGEYELEGRSVEKEYSSSGQKDVEMKITAGEETETDEIQIQVGSTSEPEISINNSTPRLGDTIEITTQGLEGEDLKLERNGEEVDEITLEDSQVEYTLDEELESGEYTLKTTRSVEGGILGELENAISNAILGPSAVKEFTVLDQQEAWISYCNANSDYDIESISEDPVEAENCILDIIVPKWFGGEVPEDTLVAENLCSDLDLASYNREAKSCTN